MQNTDSKSGDCVMALSESSLFDSQEYKVPSESENIFKIEDSKSHRQNIRYSSESSDYESDESSDSSDCDKYFDNLRKNAPAKLPILKTKGELLPEDLPPVADLHITVNSSELLKMGSILHWVVAKERNEFLVIVTSDENSNPLDEDSVLFLSSDKPLGKIHDVFGNVSKPNYVIRFNKAEDIVNKGVTAGQAVYYSPTNGELTHYVLVDVLKKQKGSDASWKDNNEPPDDQIDYSDDEQEKLAKQKRRAKTRGKEQNWNAGEEEDVAPNKVEKRDASYNQKRAFKRPSRNMFQSASHVPSRSSSHSPQSFRPTPPSSNHFGSSHLLRNAISPQPFRPPSSNSTSFLQRNLPITQNNVPSFQPFVPFPHNNVPSPQPFVPFPQSNVQSPQPFVPFPHNNVPSPQPFVPFSHNVPSPPLFRPPQHSNVPSPPLFRPPQHSNVPSPQLFRPLPLNNVTSPQSFGHFPQSNIPSPLPLGQFPHNNVSSPRPLRQFPLNVPPPHQAFPHSNTHSPQPFGPYQSFTVPPNFVLPSSNLTPSHATRAFQPHP